MKHLPDKLLSVRDLCVEYGTRRSSLSAVRSVSFDIAPGEIFALVGESGSGKTSLAHAILQLETPASGQVLFKGQALGGMNRKQLRASRRHVQAVFQDPLASLSPRRSVRQTLLEPLENFRIGNAASRNRKVKEALDAVGLALDLLDRYPGELSGGQRQRVALARAIIPGPDLIIADEPLASLDLAVRADIIELINDLRSRLGIAFLIVSHDLAVVGRLADHIAVMYLGQLMECGPATQVFSAAGHPYTQSLLAAVPAPDPATPPPVILAGEAGSALTPPPGCVFHKRCPERMSRCETEEPQESVNTKQQNHRARCHLWNP